MRNDTAHFRLYHFQNFCYLLGRLGDGGWGMYGTTQQGKGNSKDHKGQSNPRDRRYLQTVCFSQKNFEFGTKMFRISESLSIHFNSLEKRILYSILPVNSLTAQSHSSQGFCRVGPFRSPVYVDFFPVFVCILLLKTGSLDNAIQDFLLAEPLWYMSQYTIIYKFGECTRQLKFKKELKNQWRPVKITSHRS